MNKLRAVLHTVFARAIKAQLWTGANPVAAVETRRVPQRAYATLRAEEVAVLLPHVPEDWRGVFEAALYTGMRKGELFGLRKADVDLGRRAILVGRSYDRDATKGAHADALPVAAPLVPFLEAAMRSPGDLVFPWPDGRMRTREADPQKILRTALARAGLVVGYDHVLAVDARRAARLTWSGTGTRRRAGARSAAWPSGPARSPGRSGSTTSATPRRRCSCGPAWTRTGSSASCGTATSARRSGRTATWAWRTCVPRSPRSLRGRGRVRARGDVGGALTRRRRPSCYPVATRRDEVRKDEGPEVRVSPETSGPSDGAGKGI